MADLNNIVLVGNCTVDFEVKESVNGKKFARGRLAVNRSRRSAEGNAITDFFNVVVFEEKQAEFAGKHLKKGASCYVIGKVHDDVYKDKNGNKVYSKIVYVTEIGFANGESGQHVTIRGRLTKDPEIRYTNGEKPLAIARYSVAVSKLHKEGEAEADFFDCISYGRLAENIEKYLQKGTSVFVSGELQTEEYLNKDGETKKSISLVTDRVIFGRKRQEGENSTPPSTPAAIDGMTTDLDGFMNIPDGIEDELPFN